MTTLDIERRPRTHLRRVLHVRSECGRRTDVRFIPLCSCSWEGEEMITIAEARGVMCDVAIAEAEGALRRELRLASATPKKSKAA